MEGFNPVDVIKYANRLTDEEVKDIKLRLMSGDTIQFIHKDYEYKVTLSAIRKIKNGETWKNISI